MNVSRLPHRPVERHRRLARRWADRAVRVHAAAALGEAGFDAAADSLAGLPELNDDASLATAEGAVAQALRDLLTQPRGAPALEHVLLATLAAREAVAIASHAEPSTQHMRELVHAVHVTAHS